MNFRRFSSRLSNYLSNRTYSNVSLKLNENSVKYKRAILYVPGNDQKKIHKALSLGADCTLIDCEDGVAVNRKQEARENIHSLLNSNLSNKYTIRINSVQSGLAEDDIKCIFTTPNKPECVFVPKTDEVDQVKWLYEKIGAYSSDSRINFFFYMESAISLLNLRDIIQTANELSQNKYNSSFTLEGFVFGSDDYCADVGAARTKDALELLFARQYLVTMCKAYKLQAVDMVYIDFKDLNGLKEQSEQGARFGFTGKQVIHPSQIEIVQNAFSPSVDKVKWAVNLIQAFGEHQKSGKGAFTYGGLMIDRPLLLQAQNIVAMAQNNNLKKA